MKPRSIAFILAALVGEALVAAPASADCPKMRPTDPDGYAGVAYGKDPFTSYATPEGHVRVWFATSGPHAPYTADAAELAGHAVEMAIDGYTAMGFLQALRDGDYPACASNGGDDRIDVYLVHFAGADGHLAGLPGRATRRYDRTRRHGEARRRERSCPCRYRQRTLE